MDKAVDLITLGLVLGMTYALTSEGLWGAALMFFNVLFAALITFNFYEPLAAVISENVSFAPNFGEITAFMGIFVVSLLLLRLTTDSLGPSMVRFPTPLYHLGRVAFGLGASVVMAGMILLAYQVAPVQQKMLGVWDYKYQPFYGRRFDRDYLAFFQYTTGYTFARNGVGDKDPGGEFPARPILFDPKAEWLLNHQAHRFYNPEPILEPDPSDAAPAAAPGGAPGQPAGGAPPGRAGTP